MEALLLSSQDGDWEGFFVNGDLIKEGHALRDPKFWLDMGKRFNLDGCDLRIDELNDDDDGLLMDNGNFPAKLSGLKGVYPR